MSLLDRLRSDRPPGPARALEPVGALSAALTGAWAAALSLLAVALPVLLAWAASASTTATWGQALRVAADGWLLLHHVSIEVPGGAVSLAPLGLSLLPATACWLAGRRVARGHPPAEGTPRRPGPPALRALLLPVPAMAGGYAVVLTGAALLARGDGVRPVWWQAVVAGLVLPLLAGGAAAVRADRPAPTAALATALHLPARVRAWVRPAVLAVAALTAVGALTVVLALATHADRVLTLHRTLAPGVVGGAVLTLAQVGAVPNLVLWAVAWVAGPGFAVGVGTSVTPAGSTLGLLPLVPVLGAVPAGGVLPVALGAVVLVPVLVGAATGWFTASRRPRTVAVRDVLADAAAAAALAAATLALALALAGGAAGRGVLTAVGPSPWRAGLALAAELVAGAVVAAWITHRHRAP